MNIEYKQENSLLVFCFAFFFFSSNLFIDLSVENVMTSKIPEYLHEGISWIGSLCSVKKIKNYNIFLFPKKISSVVTIMQLKSRKYTANMKNVHYGWKKK